MMSAAERELIEQDEMILGGSPAPPVVLPGQIDPRSWHYFYSAGERQLVTRAKDVGYASIPPGVLVPLRPFKVKEANDTVESLFDANAPKEREITIEPRDQADALMSRYQHRGGRILFPLTGMEGASGLERAKKLFLTVHPKLTCERNQKLLARQCVHCRLEDLRGEASLDRIEKAKFSEKEQIPYGLDDEGSLRFISEVEACTIIHQLTLSANEELYVHMVDTLQVSYSDVEAGRRGPGKKKYDKRDEWYFINTHLTPADLANMSSEFQPEREGLDVGDIVSKTIKAVREGGPQVPVDVHALLADQERKHQEAMAEMEKRFQQALNKKNTPTTK